MPTLVGAATADTGASTSLASFPITNPSWNGSATPAGHVVVLYAALRGTSTFTPPAGFTPGSPVVFASTTAQVFWRVTDGSEGATFTVAYSATGIATACIVSYSGGDTVAIFDPGPPPNSGLTSTGTLPATGVTTTRNGDQLVWFGASKCNLATDTPGTITPPAGFTGQVTQHLTTAASSPNMTSFVADAAQVTAGATGTETGTTTNATEHDAALLVAVGVPGPALPMITTVPEPPGLSSPMAFTTSTRPVINAPAPAGTTWTGTGALSGTGTLAGAEATTRTRAAGMSGSGTLSGGEATTRPRAAAMAGTGTLAGAGSKTVPGTAAMSGSGTLNGTGTLSGVHTGGAALSGTGTLTGTPVTAYQRAAAMTGTGTLSGAGSKTVPGAAPLAGTGTLSGIRTVAHARTAALAGTGTLGAAGSKTIPASSTLAGSGTLSGAALVVVSAVAGLSGAGSLAGLPHVTRARAALLSGTGTLAGAAAPRTAHLLLAGVSAGAARDAWAAGTPGDRYAAGGAADRWAAGTPHG